jgi:hypothetical protein
MKDKFKILDTYDADLKNENPPRREQISEIHVSETGALLCYADPDCAKELVELLNATYSFLDSSRPSARRSLRYDMDTAVIRLEAKLDNEK